jgi:hypothetical protein
MITFRKRTPKIAKTRFSEKWSKCAKKISENWSKCAKKKFLKIGQNVQKNFENWSNCAKN